MLLPFGYVMRISRVVYPLDGKNDKNAGNTLLPVNGRDVSWQHTYIILPVE